MKYLFQRLFLTKCTICFIIQILFVNTNVLNLFYNIITHYLFVSHLCNLLSRGVSLRKETANNHPISANVKFILRGELSGLESNPSHDMVWPLFRDQKRVKKQKTILLAMFKRTMKTNQPSWVALCLMRAAEALWLFKISQDTRLTSDQWLMSLMLSGASKISSLSLSLIPVQTPDT